jgi:hypothetical protein
MTLFEGTDLSMAYGGFSDQQPYNQQAFPTAPTVQSMQLPPVVQQPPPQAPRQMVSVQQPNEQPYNPPEAMYVQQPAVPQVQQEDSFLDRLSAHRYDVLKVAMFAFVILLAISLDRFFNHYLSQYISQAILTTTQEVLVRVSYPVAVLLVIWFVKAM